jgi:hypothetical protein
MLRRLSRRTAGIARRAKGAAKATAYRAIADYLKWLGVP